MKKIFRLFGSRNYFIAVVIVLILGAFLRLYKIEEYVTFLGDQGRDAIIMKNIITLKNFPALGPITSVGSIYLGPFYYYLMAPWLRLFGLNPLGPAVGVAVLSVVSIGFLYLAVKDLTDELTGLLTVTLVSFSWVLIEYSRYSWNPNLLAPISFFAVYTAMKAVKTHRIIWYLLTGVLLSAAVQLHYLAVFLLPFTAGLFLYSFIKDKRSNTSKKVRGLMIALIAFFVIYSPFILFEAKHHFPNTISAINFVRENSSGKERHAGFISELNDTSHNLIQFAFHVNLLPPIIPILGLAFIGFLTLNRRVGKKQLEHENNIAVIAIAFFTFLFGTAIYHGPKFPHYLGSLYIPLYILVAYALRKILNRVAVLPAGIVIMLLLTVYIATNASHYIFLWQKEGPKEIRHARRIAQGILSLNPVQPFTLTSSPEAYADYPYRYFLEAWNKAPVKKEEDAYVRAKELYVVCEKKCDPTKDSQWAIAHFSANRIADEKTADGVYIYKLVR